MAELKKYTLNPETLLYEIEKAPAKSKWARFVWIALLMFVLMLFYLWIFISLFGVELPKTTILKRINSEWVARMELMNRELDRYETGLDGMQMRDDDIYRNIFGLDRIASQVRNSGFSSVNRYDYLEGVEQSSMLRKTAMRLDYLTKKAYVQSRSFDDIQSLAQRADDMASCIPTVIPINPNPSTFRRSSAFGYRTDPFTKATKMHTGYDFACPPGNPVYAPGDGVVKEVKFELFGYGNSVVIDHGFGYKTRYAHLRNVFVAEGMKLKRGECIGETGNSGRSSGPHLHYEVMYRDRFVNPVNFFDFDMPSDEYMAMVEKAQAQSKNIIVRPNQRVKRR